MLSFAATLLAAAPAASLQFGPPALVGEKANSLQPNAVWDRTNERAYWSLAQNNTKSNQQPSRQAQTTTGSVQQASFNNGANFPTSEKFVKNDNYSELIQATLAGQELHSQAGLSSTRNSSQSTSYNGFQPNNNNQFAPINATDEASQSLGNNANCWPCDESEEWTDQWFPDGLIYRSYLAGEP